jgi:hypothetical protein
VKETTMRKLLVALSFAVTLAGPALADWTGKDALGTTITFKNPNTCSSVACIPTAQPVDSTGAAFGVAGNPLRTDPTGTTIQPVSAASLPLPTGAANATNQTSQITQETATATGVGTPTDAPATAPATTSSATMIQLLKALLNGGQYPAGAVAITASATGTTLATTATLAGAVGKTTYVCGYSIRANATAAATVTDTLTGVISGTMSSVLWVAPLASGLGVDEQIFNPCIPASTTNTAIAAVSGAPGAGGTVTVKAWGYQL